MLAENVAASTASGGSFSRGFQNLIRHVERVVKLLVLRASTA
jgi:hypothetical protein